MVRRSISNSHFPPQWIVSAWLDKFITACFPIELIDNTRKFLLRRLMHTTWNICRISMSNKTSKSVYLRPLLSGGGGGGGGPLREQWQRPELQHLGMPLETYVSCLFFVTWHSFTLILVQPRWVKVWQLPQYLLMSRVPLLWKWMDWGPGSPHTLSAHDG